MPVALLLGDVQDNVRRILLANAIPVVPGATDRMVQLAEPQSSPKKVRFPSRVTYNQLLIPQSQEVLDLTPFWQGGAPEMYGSGSVIGLA